MLAAGIQVPIAAGAWLLVHLAGHTDSDADPDHALWETPPTDPSHVGDGPHHHRTCRVWRARGSLTAPWCS